MHVLNGGFEPDDLRKLADALEATNIRPILSCFQFVITDSTFITLLNELDKHYGYDVTQHSVKALSSCKDCHAYSYCGNKKEET